MTLSARVQYLLVLHCLSSINLYLIACKDMTKDIHQGPVFKCLGPRQGLTTLRGAEMERSEYENRMSGSGHRNTVERNLPLHGGAGGCGAVSGGCIGVSSERKFRRSTLLTCSAVTTLTLYQI